MKRDTPLPLCASANILNDLTLFPSLLRTNKNIRIQIRQIRQIQIRQIRTNKNIGTNKANKNIRISYPLKYKHLKKKNYLRKNE